MSDLRTRQSDRARTDRRGAKPSGQQPDRAAKHPAARRSSKFKGLWAGESAWLVWMGSFALLLALTGGSSHPDVIQLVPLRAFAVLFCAAATYVLLGERRTGMAREGAFLLALLAGLGGWMLIQLVPLPPPLWQALPDRSAIAALDQAIGTADTWRPIALVPTRGWNALASLVVPAAALLLALAFRARLTQLLAIILGLALFDGALDIVQVTMGERELAYLYRPHPGHADGMFANENHSGVFSALGLLIAARLGIAGGAHAGESGDWKRPACAAAFIFLLIAVLVGGSRAGIVTGLFAVFVSVAMIALAGPGMGGKAASARSKKRRSASRGKPGSAGVAPAASSAIKLDPKRALAGFVAALALLIASFVWSERSPALDGVLVQNTFEDLRWELAPILGQMIEASWLLGSGFGSFEEYYHLYEPTALLFPKYINQAHNDWAQLLIEGGLVAAALCAGLLVWVGRRLTRLVARTSSNKTGSRNAFASALFWAGVAAIIAAASIVDYPLRTPIFQGVLAWLLVALALDTSARSSRGRAATA